MNETMIDAAVHIRWMIKRDLDEVLKIENECFAEPWSEADFVSELTRQFSIGKVAEVCELVGGYMVYSIPQDRIELLNFAVRADVQRRGIGSALIDSLKSKLHPSRRRKIVAHVRESNLAAQLFLRANGFIANRIESGIYDGEDAYRFVFLCRECVGK